MRILLANPSCKQSIDNKYEKYFIRAGSRWPHSGVKRKGTIPHYLPFPFYLACSAAKLQESGFDVHTLDAIALDLSERSFLEMAAKIKPDLLFFEVTTPTINYDLKLLVKIREVIPDAIISIGGAHATTFAEQILADNPVIDVIFQGEYELALNDLALSYSDSQNRPRRCVIPRRAIGDNNVTSLSGVPFPAYDMFPIRDKSDPTVYWDGFCQLYPAIQMQTSRGCPNQCYFCLWNSVIYDHGAYRVYDPELVVAKMADLVTVYKAKEIYFDDDSFTVKKSHVVAICNALTRQNINVKWSCMADVAHLDEQLLQTMSLAGCIGIKFGVESGSNKVLKHVGKPVDLTMVQNIVRCCRKFNIKSHATFTIGLLEESEHDVQQTLAYAAALGADSIQISIATPFPGTRFYDTLQKQGLVSERGWEEFDGKCSAINLSPLLDRGRVEELRKRAMLRWLLKTVFIPTNLLRHRRIIIRTIQGLGIRKFMHKLSATLIDGYKNK
ncbi:radical SAM protein [Geobacter pelophilus]|uniref:Radical SAM protein n=1 Tax=Geoanaerobacter pelophilus TaxID=60036 RepID=A0AAW4KYU2_9BACT|nr:radical SAM protein [Geoanaerobacter pelophilus]MBT0663718.1 radical SAM protein [Geoanaerobacter pelophilus]